MLKEYAGVVPLINSPRGWNIGEVKINHDPNPTYTPELNDVLEAAKQKTIDERTKFGDFNDPKAAVRSVTIQGSRLIVDTALTEYFVLWGLPKAAPKYHQQALDELDKQHRTKIPMGISTHNIILLGPDGPKSPADEISIVMIVNDPSHGFAPGRLSVSYEGQMDPTKDLIENNPSTFKTVLRTLEEEFGVGLERSRVKVNPQNIRLLAVCAEKGSAYTSWCHAIWIKAGTQDFVNSYNLALRRRHADALLATPIKDISTFTRDSIAYEDCRPHIINGSLGEKTILKPHPTVPWRIDALIDYLKHQGIL